MNSQLVLARSARVEAASRLGAAQAQGGGGVKSTLRSSPVIEALRERQADLQRQQANLDSR
jgi:uncharacterized protein involved in exopolysaccharide biosynthesis